MNYQLKGIVTKNTLHTWFCKVSQINFRRLLHLFHLFLKSVFATILLVLGVVLLLVNLRKPLF